MSIKEGDVYTEHGTRGLRLGQWAQARHLGSAIDSFETMCIGRGLPMLIAWQLEVFPIAIPVPIKRVFCFAHGERM